MMRRRELLQTTAVAWFAEQALGDHRRITGELRGASHRVGHILRQSGGPRAEGPPESAEVVVVGSGASGLSCAWRLQAAGLPTRILELESFIGGTSTWGEDGASPHPWGAHYLPVPEPGATGALRLLSELRVLTGWDAAGRPRFRADMLCHAPEERIFYRGEWYGGLVPRGALTAPERHEVDRFTAIVEALSTRRGRDGRPAFTLPAHLSSRDPELLALDRLSMRQWLDREGFVTPIIRWLVQYATLDAFGATLDTCSAWAGLLYFAARNFESEQLAGSRYLVWPEGNGYLLRGLRQLGRPTITHGALAVDVTETRRGVEVTYVDTSAGVERAAVRRIEAKAAVLAVPAFIAQRLVKPPPSLQRTTSSWLVANLHLRRKPDPKQAWDSVIHGAEGLGYVDADHQGLRDANRTVWTYFRAFGDADDKGVRQHLLERRWADHASAVLSDLAPAHPTLVGDLDRIDVMVWGHAMPRPVPGFLGRGDPWAHPVMLSPRIGWAHVDLTGFALFEEANAHGLRAAEAVCDALGAPRGDSWLTV